MLSLEVDFSQFFSAINFPSEGHDASHLHSPIKTAFAAKAALRLLFLNVVGAAWSLGIGLVSPQGLRWPSSRAARQPCYLARQAAFSIGQRASSSES